MKVVVVDESSFVLDVVRHALELAGAEVQCAHPLDHTPRDAVVVAERRLAVALGDVILVPLVKQRGIGDLVRRCERALGLERKSDPGAAPAAFRAQLVCVARRRLRHALDLLGVDHVALADELRTFAGEAYLVDERALGDLASSAQAHAERLLRDPEERTACARALNVIAGALAEHPPAVSCR